MIFFFMRTKKIVALLSLLMLLGAGCARRMPPTPTPVPPIGQKNGHAITVRGLTFTLSKPDWKIVQEGETKGRIRVPYPQALSGEALYLDLAVESARSEDAVEILKRKPDEEGGKAKLWEEDYSGDCMLQASSLLVDQRMYTATWMTATDPTRVDAEGASCGDNAGISSEELSAILLTAQPAASAPMQAPVTFALQGLTFTLPKADWKIANNNGYIADILISRPPYDVRLGFSVRPDDKRAWHVTKVLSEEEGMRISSRYCEAGHGNTCYGLEAPFGTYGITTSWGTGTTFRQEESEEEWSRIINYSEDDLVAMLKTAAITK